ncbi:MAG: pyrroline-5-carboxylate reductase [Verrucomicrobia bacterium]|nr:pyrroline-5-carboxylate reductase [Verrucomicrobiota bacterium]
MSPDLTLGFLGAGKMAAALAKGFIRGGLAEAGRVVASDIVAAARETFAREVGARVTASNSDVVRMSRVLVLAVKPDHVAPVLGEVAPSFTREHLLISIAAGIPTARIESALPAGSRVIRVMPNTPALVGASASAFAPGRHATGEDASLAMKLFSSVGVAMQLKETLLDAVTGLSGSGPAYVFTVIEALSDGGVAAGLPRDAATKLAAQTVFGAAKLLLETSQHPGALKDAVTSPGGTTIEGLHELERAGVRSAFISAVRAAADKSRKLGQS